MIPPGKRPLWSLFRSFREADFSFPIRSRAMDRLRSIGDGGQHDLAVDSKTNARAFMGSGPPVTAMGVRLCLQAQS
jgi:hypothetical protein